VRDRRTRLRRDAKFATEHGADQLGAAFLFANLAVTNTPRIDHSQYCASWLAVWKDDDKAIFTAASLATRAVDYLFGQQPDPAPDAAADHDAPLSADGLGAAISARRLQLSSRGRRRHRGSTATPSAATPPARRASRSLGETH
jgi:hypothetical protein